MTWFWIVFTIGAVFTFFSVVYYFFEGLDNDRKIEPFAFLVLVSVICFGFCVYLLFPVSKDSLEDEIIKIEQTSEDWDDKALCNLLAKNPRPSRKELYALDHQMAVRRDSLEEAYREERTKDHIDGFVKKNCE